MIKHIMELKEYIDVWYKESKEMLNEVKELVPYHKEERFETFDEIREFFKSKGKEYLYSHLEKHFETTGYHTTFEPHMDFKRCFLKSKHLALSPLKKSELTQNIVEFIDKYPAESEIVARNVYNVGKELRFTCRLRYSPHIYGKYFSEGDPVSDHDGVVPFTRAATKEDVEEIHRYDGMIDCSGTRGLHLNQKGEERVKTELMEVFRKTLNQCDITEIDGEKPFTQMEFENIQIRERPFPSGAITVDFNLK